MPGYIEPRKNLKRDLLKILRKNIKKAKLKIDDKKFKKILSLSERTFK